LAGTKTSDAALVHSHSGFILNISGLYRPAHPLPSIMPKANKKKKEKHADFSVSYSVVCPCRADGVYQKAKLKLGKGKKQASNATDTSFKARCECDSAMGHGAADLTHL
jgi:hypothetical protein